MSIAIIVSFMSLFSSSEFRAIPTTKELYKICTIQNRSYQDTLISYLYSLDIAYYKNRPIDTFLVKLPANFIDQKIYGSGRPKYADVLIVTYPNGIVVHIFVRRFTHMNPKSNVLQWNINLFKLEDVDHIEIHNGVNCVKGCP